MKKAILISLSLYKRFLSPCFPPSCRFLPTCSDYSYEAFNKYGVLRGISFTIRRLAKCHPFHKGGYDPLI